MADFDAINFEETRMSTEKSAKPPRLRLKLRTIDDCAVELAKLYKAAKAGEIETADASRLGNLLSILSRMIQGGELERRITRLEESEAAHATH